MVQSESDALTFIWFVNTYHCNMRINIPILLKNWSMDIAKPYLEKHHPDRLTPDTSDPRKGWLQYNKTGLMEIEEGGKLPALPNKNVN